jgi:hypothetical protein
MRTTISVYLLEQAAKCRRLARSIPDNDIAQKLLALADEYEAKADCELEEYNSDETVH